MKALLPVDECCSAREVGLLGGFVEFQVGLVRTLGGFCTISMKESCEAKHGFYLFCATMIAHSLFLSGR